MFRTVILGVTVGISYVVDIVTTPLRRELGENPLQVLGGIVVRLSLLRNGTFLHVVVIIFVLSFSAIIIVELDICFRACVVVNVALYVVFLTIEDKPLLATIDGVRETLIERMVFISRDYCMALVLLGSRKIVEDSSHPPIYLDPSTIASSIRGEVENVIIVGKLLRDS